MDSININSQEQFEDHIIIDIRTLEEYAYGTLPGAINIPMDFLLEKHEQLLKAGNTYYLLCATGKRCSYIDRVLSDENYHFINLEGGYLEYKKT